MAVAAIEGQPGFDREVYDSSAQTIHAFADWGIDDAGVIYESNGKTPGSLEFLTLSMVALWPGAATMSSAIRTGANC